MVMTKPAPTETRPPPKPAARFGYAVSILVNGLMLWVVTNLLDWDIFPFLTEEFSDVVPYIAFSLVASIVVNAMYLWFDPHWFKSLTQIGLFVIGLVVTVRIFSVFPFDFSAYDFPWAGTTRTVLILAMVGVCIGMIVEAVKLFGRPARR